MTTTRALATMLVLAMTAAAAPRLLACGDKFLVPIRGTRFQRPPGPRPAAAILIYANPASGLPQALANINVQTTLSKVGYRPSIVSTGADFDRALDRGGWDVVLVGGPDVTTVQDRLTSKTGPAILPVLRNPTQADVAKAKAECTLVIKGPTKNQAFLDAVDEAVEFHARAMKAAKSKQ